jgi:hypothetical protein
VSNAPVCHISKDQDITEQPKATLLPFVPAAIDLPSALQAIAALKLIVQMLSGQVQPNPSNGTLQAGLQPPAPNPNTGKGNPNQNERFVENRQQRVVKKVRIFQNKDKTSSNWVDINQINSTTWYDTVTGETIVWSR